MACGFDRWLLRGDMVSSVLGSVRLVVCTQRCPMVNTTRDLVLGDLLAGAPPNTSLHRTPAAAPPSPVSSKPLGVRRSSRAPGFVGSMRRGPQPRTSSPAPSSPAARPGALGAGQTQG